MWGDPTPPPPSVAQGHVFQGQNCSTGDYLTIGHNPLGLQHAYDNLGIQSGQVRIGNLTWPTSMSKSCLLVGFTLAMHFETHCNVLQRKLKSVEKTTFLHYRAPCYRYCICLIILYESGESSSICRSCRASRIWYSSEIHSRRSKT